MARAQAQGGPGSKEPVALQSDQLRCVSRTRTRQYQRSSWPGLQHLRGLALEGVPGRALAAIGLGRLRIALAAALALSAAVTVFIPLVAAGSAVTQAVAAGNDGAGELAALRARIHIRVDALGLASR